MLQLGERRAPPRLTWHGKTGVKLRFPLLGIHINSMLKFVITAG